MHIHTRRRIIKERKAREMQITQEEKKEIFKEYGGDASNTGSIEAQVALLTEEISHITDHLRSNKKDHSARLSLVKKVGKRRKFLKYLAKKDINNYRSLIEKLGLRK